MKKFLSLVLALVMTMSLVTISAGATEFKDLTDVDSIEHKEAVELFNKIGIITGYEDGSFGPEKTITREQAAKIIAIMALGNDAAAQLGAEKAPFPDVPATSQFAGYIGYCVSAGIIDGYKDGTFKPKGTLTGYQFAKMLLGVIGYGVNDEYVGSNWALNVARDGATIGLFKDATVTAGLINRDNATQIAFNALKSDLVAWSDLLGAYTNKANPLAGTTVGEQTLLGTLAQNIFKLTPAYKTDSYGYDTRAWRQSGRVITSYYRTGEVVATITDMGTTGNNIYKDYAWEVNNSGDAVVLDVYYNGASVANTMTGSQMFKGGDKLSKAANALGIAALPALGNGSTVVLVDEDDDGSVDKIVMTYSYLAKVTKVTAATSTTDRKVTLNVNVAGVTNATPETEKFAKDEYILVTPAGTYTAAVAGNPGTPASYTENFNEPLDMASAEIVTGAINAYYRNTATYASSAMTGLKNDGSVTVDGTKYSYDKSFNSKDVLGADLSAGSYKLNKATYNFYLDANGYVIGVEVKQDAINDYAYIIAVGEDAFQSSKVVKALLSDGTIKTLTVSSKSNIATALNKDGSDKGRIFSYSINADNEIVLDDLTAPYDYVKENNAKPVSFTKGYSIISNADGVVAYATDTTVFMYVDAKGNVTTFTGKATAPSINAKAASVAYETKTVNGGSVKYATFVVLYGVKAETTMTTNYLYVEGKTGYAQDVNGDPVYLYKVVLNGKEVTIAADSSTVAAGYVYTYGYNESLYTGSDAEPGVYTLEKLTDAERLDQYNVVALAPNNNVLVTGTIGDKDAVQYIISDTTEIVDLTAEVPSAGATVSVGDSITVVFSKVDSLKVAQTVYITKKASNAAILGTTGALNTLTYIKDIRITGAATYDITVAKDTTGTQMLSELKFSDGATKAIYTDAGCTAAFTESDPLTAGTNTFYVKVSNGVDNVYALNVTVLGA